MALKLTREFYIPKGSMKIIQKDGDGIAYLYTKKTTWGFVAFHGTRSAKPDLHYTYNTEVARNKAVAKFFESRKEITDWKIENRSSKSGRDLKVGDIVYASWGYDQTNIDFYQVVALKGNVSVVVRKIAQHTVKCAGPMSERVVAVKDQFIGLELTRRCRKTYVRIDDVRSASIWDGRPLYQSHTH
ncbi:MAG: hypothetical protein HC836_10535 [Richelia sp. RM2_1_2]|nr:hypothetical protein [Richelia sp. RM2_1_2]